MRRTISNMEDIDVDEHGSVWGMFLRVKAEVNLMNSLVRGKQCNYSVNMFNYLPRLYFKYGVIKHG